MRKRILAYRRLDEQQLDQLRERYQVDYFGKLASADDPAFREALGQVHGLIGAGVKITSELLTTAPNLETISSISVGVDSYPVEELTRRGILLSHTRTCSPRPPPTPARADHGDARRVVELAEYVKRGEWQASIGAEQFGTDVHGKTLGMIGFGRIGQAIARRGALGFGMRVLYAKASPKPALEQALGARHCELDELLREADFVCAIVPLNADTRHLIGAAEFARMKSSAIFINLARGEVVDEAAMIDALERGEIRGAGLDVFAQEPLPADSPLPRMANVVALPHIGSATHETRTAMAQRAVDNLLLALEGKRPLSPFNPEVWPERLG
ncbi:2-hydroxyacid dehydrogenase [Salinicola tamaricis]|uniref:2-hydroxyacid dehydrogenase n=1 Tax=Salinicola tamaricis TaxID=1771309 RepID=UPI001F5DFA1C|nr:D-glycerate dehydrogenase [Salinicola tamaricis]